VKIGESIDKNAALASSNLGGGLSGMRVIVFFIVDFIEHFVRTSKIIMQQMDNLFKTSFSIRLF
jgi:hypothetical protein